MPNGNQLIKAYALLRQVGATERKETIVLGFTNQRSKHISDMEDGEFKAFILHLETLVPNAKESQKMRRKIISLAHEMGWWVKDSRGKLVLSKGKAKADMKRIDGWCTTFGKYGKKLDAHTYDELVHLLTQFKIVHKKYLAELKTNQHAF